MKPFSKTGLGPLELLPGSPPDQKFWRGTFLWRDGDGSMLSSFYLCAGNLEHPSEELIAFASRIMARIDRHVAAAEALVRATLIEGPSALVADGAAEAPCEMAVDGAIYLDVPEPTFFEPGAWHLRFAQCSFPGSSPLGVAVMFSNEQPTRAENLVADEVIDPSPG